jgi:hypothetical protein
MGLSVGGGYCCCFRGEQDCGNDGAATDAVADGEDGIDPGRALFHDVQPEVIGPVSDRSDAVVLDAEFGKRWLDATGDPHVLGL